MHPHRKLVSIICLLWLGLSPFITLAKEVAVTFLTFADIYNLHPIQGGGGLLSLKRMIDQQKKLNQNTFVLVSGDILATNGPENQTKGKTIVEILNSFNIDIASLGNHDFAFDIDALKQRIAESNFVWLATNVMEKNGSPLAGTVQTKIYTVDSIKIGFFAICLPETAKRYPKSCNNKIDFKSIIYSAQKAIDSLLLENVDVIVALTHLDLEQDILLAKRFPVIKVIAGGHDHKNISTYINNTLIHKSGCNGKFIGRIDLKINKLLRAKNNNRNNIDTNVSINWSTIENSANSLIH